MSDPSGRTVRGDRGGFSRWMARWRSRVQWALGGGGYLCDRCKLNYGSVCMRAQRPNATVCEDFVAKG